MKHIFKTLTTLLAIVSIAVLSSCSDSSSANSGDLKTDIAGTWNVTRTLVTPSNDFPQGYQDIQEWSFTVNGSSAVMTTKDGSMQGSWKSSENFNYEHWVFSAQGQHPYIPSMTILIKVEIIGVNKLKGTNETYYWDAMNSRWILLDGFTIEGVKK